MGVTLLASPASSQVVKDDAVRSSERTPEAAGVTPGSRVRASCERPVRASSGATEDREPPAPRAPAALTPAESRVDPVVETNAFEQAAQRYAKLWTFTSKLEVTREQREFERAATRYARLRDFTDKLQAQREREQEDVFNRNVSTYLRKQAFTNRLIENRQRNAGR